MSLFGKSTQEKAVEALTMETLREPNMAGNLDFADAINRSPDDGKEALKQLMKRLKHKNPHVQMLGLQLLDLCVKNSSTAFHQNLGTKDHMKQLSEMAVDKKIAGAVREFILTLIETWNEAFTRPHEFQLPIFGETYQKLKLKEVEFPPRDMAALAPVSTPAPNLHIVNGVNIAAQQQQEARRGGGAVGANPYDYQQAPGAGGPPGSNQPPLHQQQASYIYPQGAPVPGGYGGGPPLAMLASPVHQQPGYQYPPAYPAQQAMHVPMANPVYINQQPYRPGGPQQQQQQYAPPHMMQQQQPPPQQQPPQQPPQQLLGRPRTASQAAAYRAQLKPDDLRLYEQCTYLSQPYVDKIKKETHLTFEYIALLRDLSSASEGAAQLKRDALATNLATTLGEVRNRYTKLILEVGDVTVPAAASAVEFLIDLSIRMIDVIRVILDYYKLKCDGVRGLNPPEIVMPRGLAPASAAAGSGNGARQQQQPQQSQQQQQAAYQAQQAQLQSFSAVPPSQQQPQQSPPPQRSAPVVDAAGAGNAPRTMQLFDMPPNSEDDQKIAASMFARKPKGSPAPAAGSPSMDFFAAGSDAVAVGEVVGGEPGSQSAQASSRPAPQPAYVSPDSFSSAQGFNESRAPTSKYALPAGAAAINAVTSPTSRYAEAQYGADGVTPGALPPVFSHAESFAPAQGFAPRSQYGGEPAEAKEAMEQNPFDDSPPQHAQQQQEDADRSMSGLPHTTRAQDDAARDAAERERRFQASQARHQPAEDPNRVYDQLAPMRGLGADMPGQGILRKTSLVGAPAPAPTAASEEGRDDAGPLSPGGPNTHRAEAASSSSASAAVMGSSPPAVAPSGVSVNDDFLEELMGLTIKQPQNEGEQ